MTHSVLKSAKKGLNFRILGFNALLNHRNIRFLLKNVLENNYSHQVSAAKFTSPFLIVFSGEHQAAIHTNKASRQSAGGLVLLLPTMSTMILPLLLRRRLLSMQEFQRQWKQLCCFCGITENCLPRCILFSQLENCSSSSRAKGFLPTFPDFCHHYPSNQEALRLSKKAFFFCKKFRTDECLKKRAYY